MIKETQISERLNLKGQIVGFIFDIIKSLLLLYNCLFGGIGRHVRLKI